MTPNSAIERTLREIVGRLVRKDYQGLELLTHATRLRAQEIEAGVRDYGRTLVLPPPEAFSRADIVPIQGTNPPAYSVRFRLYTQEEGASDLELQATFVGQSDDEMMVVQLDNIIVA
jgi:hypothetical protein